MADVMRVVKTVQGMGAVVTVAVQNGGLPGTTNDSLPQLAAKLVRLERWLKRVKAAGNTAQLVAIGLAMRRAQQKKDDGAMLNCVCQLAVLAAVNLNPWVGALNLALNVFVGPDWIAKVTAGPNALQRDIKRYSKHGMAHLLNPHARALNQIGTFNRCFVVFGGLKLRAKKYDRGLTTRQTWPDPFVYVRCYNNEGAHRSYRTSTIANVAPASDGTFNCAGFKPPRIELWNDTKRVDITVYDQDAVFNDKLGSQTFHNLFRTKGRKIERTMRDGDVESLRLWFITA